MSQDTATSSASIIKIADTFANRVDHHITTAERQFTAYLDKSQVAGPRVTRLMSDNDKSEESWIMHQLRNPDARPDSYAFETDERKSAQDLAELESLYETIALLIPHRSAPWEQGARRPSLSYYGGGEESTVNYLSRRLHSIGLINNVISDLKDSIATLETTLSKNSNSTAAGSRRDLVAMKEELTEALNFRLSIVDGYTNTMFELRDDTVCDLEWTRATSGCNEREIARQEALLRYANDTGNADAVATIEDAIRKGKEILHDQHDYMRQLMIENNNIIRALALVSELTSF